MSNPETIANIVAEMCSLVKPGETLEHTYELLNGLADRIEAAHARKVGNGAKMREALKAVRMFLDGYTVNNLELRRMVDAALAEPARNCDVGTVDEQTERFVDFARLYFQSEVVRFTLNWAQMPYESEVKK